VQQRLVGSLVTGGNGRKPYSGYLLSVLMRADDRKFMAFNVAGRRGRIASALCRFGAPRPKNGRTRQADRPVTKESHCWIFNGSMANV
jgi:hypothetical protein